MRFQAVFIFFYFIFQIQAVFALSSDQIKTLLSSGSFVKANQALLSTSDLEKLYSKNNYEPIWIQGGKPSAFALELKKNIEILSLKHGLIASDYWTADTEVYSKNVTSNSEIAFEILASKAVVNLAGDLNGGRIDPTMLDNDTRFSKKAFSDFDLLARALQSQDSMQLIATLESIAPQHDLYRNLVVLLADLQKIKQSGGFKSISKPSKEIVLGTKNPAVPAIRERVKQFGYDLQGAGDVYDQELSAAIQEIQRENKFQIHANLKTDSGFWVLVAQSADARIAQVQANLEKLRWLPRTLEPNRIFVNTNASEVKVFENGNFINGFKSINGRPLRRTPMMRTWIGRVIFNPKWTATDSIVLQDKIPAIVRDPGYLDRVSMKIYNKRTNQLVDPFTLNFQSDARRIVRENMFVMDPGPNNALGVFKFPLTTDPKQPRGSNSDDIYLHFTDDPSLFEKPGPRLLSSGCVRLEQAAWLAAYLLRRVNGYDPVSIDNIIAKGLPWQTFQTDMSVMLPTQDIMTVYTLPMTVELTESGKPRFMRDHYYQDRRIQNAIMSQSVRKAAASGFVTSVEVDGAGQGGIQVIGEAGRTQRFMQVTAVRCDEPQFAFNAKTSMRTVQRRCDDAITFSLNQVKNVPTGQYIVGFENSVFPGFVTVSAGQVQRIQLQKISVPEAMKSETSVRVFRDFSHTVEQKKLYFEKFYYGKNLFKQALREFGDLYVGGSTDLDAIAPSDYKFCSENNLSKLKVVSDIREHALFVCEAYNQAQSMLDYADLFQFASNGTYQEAVVDYPGDIFPRKNMRHLVGTPLQADDFVSVMPGAYRILADTAKTEQKVAYLNSGERYPPSTRTFSVMKNANEMGDAFSALGSSYCQGATLWRTSERSYCASDSTMGCNRNKTLQCDELKLDLRFRK